jgi:hypothetical protein
MMGNVLESAVVQCELASQRFMLQQREPLLSHSSTLALRSSFAKRHVKENKKETSKKPKETNAIAAQRKDARGPRA